MKSRKQLFLIILFFLSINLIFNFRLFLGLFEKKVVVNDNIITEYLIETSYQNILHFKNPFIADTILYPQKINFSLNDPNTAFVLPFFVLRPFFDAHQSFLLITLFSFVLNNLFMYFLLIKLKLNKLLAIIMALVFGFTPFLSHRILSHYTYVPIYFFPLIYLIVIKLLEAKNFKIKMTASITLGLLLGLILLSNFYYFFMIVLVIVAFIIYHIFLDKKKTFNTIFLNYRFLVILVITFCFSLIPWFLSVYKLLKAGDQSVTPGFGGSITLSADVLSFFTPSEYNPIYKKLFSLLSFHIPYFKKYNDFFLNSLERFSYPGLIILIIYFLIFFLKIYKKFPEKLWQEIKSYFTISIIFAVLMLGPFLKIFNRWMINLDGVTLVIPLPFLLFHYIPGVATLRAPARFTPVFVFLACIVSAYTINFLIKKINQKRRLILLVIIFFIFFIDQFYVIPSQIQSTVPIKIYNYLKNTTDKNTVLEIPFTVRDGFRYIGFVHAIQPMYGHLIHGKPIIGGYLARIPDSVFMFYKKTKFIEYLSKIIDKGNYSVMKEKPNELVFFPYPQSINSIKQELNIFKIRYIILKTDEKYSSYLEKLFVTVGFNKILMDENYFLYIKTQ